MVFGDVSLGPLQQDARFAVKRRSFNSPFTLFSFQDIMSSVSAVVILVTLLLCVELVNRHAADAEGPSSEQLETIRSEIAGVEEEVAHLKTRIDAYNALAKKLAGKQNYWTIAIAATLRARSAAWSATRRLLSTCLPTAKRNRRPSPGRSSLPQSAI